ncbi:hypothetical protein VPH35_116784 [Triticum aestivum]
MPPLSPIQRKTFSGSPLLVRPAVAALAVGDHVRPLASLVAAQKESSYAPPVLYSLCELQQHQVDAVVGVRRLCLRCRGWSYYRLSNGGKQATAATKHMEFLVVNPSANALMICAWCTYTFFGTKAVVRL